MTPIRVLIIDDEPDSIRLTKYMLSKNNAEFSVASSNGGEDALSKINTFNPDLIFLDIQMPIYNGFELLSKVQKRQFEVIFLTAFDEYAIQAIKNCALDYLLKPLKQIELNAAIEQYQVNNNRFTHQKLTQLIREYNLYTQESHHKIALPDLDGIVFLHLDDILFFEANDIMSMVYLKDGNKKNLNISLKKLEEKIENPHFFRVHKSYYININHISKIKKQDGISIILYNDKEIPISRLKKEEFYDLINSNF